MREIKFRAMPRYTNMCQDELKEMTQYDGTFIYGHLIDNYIARAIIREIGIMTTLKNRFLRDLFI